MAKKLTDAQVALCRAKSFAAVATLGEDGSPQTSIVWVDSDGENVVFNTMNTRAKGKNLRRDPRVSVTIFDAANPYDYFEVEGTVALDLEGADEHIHELSRKYTGNDFTNPSDRVIVRVQADRISDYGIS
jgi:PPOX class probable F420-dependent enzyme